MGICVDVDSAARRRGLRELCGDGGHQRRRSTLRGGERRKGSRAVMLFVVFFSSAPAGSDAGQRLLQGRYGKLQGAALIAGPDYSVSIHCAGRYLGR